MDNRENRLIKLDEKNVFKSKLESANEFANSFFYECYFNAYKGVKDIIKNEEDIRSENKNSTSIKYTDDYNNIIAFLGDRGSGKTSTMKSFAKSLKDKEQGFKLKDEEEIFSKAYFEVLDTIDPSLFTNKESLVEIVVAEMFKCFKNYPKTCGLTKKQELVKLFEEVFQEIRILNMNKETIFKESNDNIETLIDLSSALSLRKDLKKLIEVYIEYMKGDGEEDKKAQFLVIPIDDLDMNLTVGEKLLEDIRRYLIQANVIILLGVKFEQLQEIVTQKFVVGLNDNFKFNAEVYRNINTNTQQYNPLVDFKSDIDEKVEKYLDKLLPYNRRCYMPVLDSSEIEVSLKGNFFDNIRIDSDKEYCNLWELVKVNFYKKLDYIIMSENHYRAIVPKNLRALIELLILLNSMENENKKENLYNMRKYYNQVVINQVSDREDILFLRDLLYCYFDEIKKRSLLFLNKKILEIIDGGEFNLNKIEEDLEYVDKNKTLINSDRITLGDIVTWIKIYETIESSNKDRKFIEIFKSVYTLRLLHGCVRDKNDLENNIGVNFIGEYFKVTNNKRKKEFSLEGYLPGKSDFSERFKNISVVEKNKNIKRIDKKAKIKTIAIYNKKTKIITSKIRGEKIKFKKINKEITMEDLLERIPLIMQPSFDSEYDRLTRREKSNYRELNNFHRFEKFNIYPINIIGYNIIKEGENKIEFVINIDCFLSILNLLDKQLQNTRDSKGDSIIKIIKKFNMVSINLNKMELCYDEIDKGPEGYEKIEFIDEESMVFIKYFIENYIPVLIQNDVKITQIEESKKIIDGRLKYLQDKKIYNSNALRDTIDKLDKILGDKKEKTEYSKQLQKVVSYKNKFKSGSKFDKQDNVVNDFRFDLTKMENILDDVLRELKG